MKTAQKLVAIGGGDLRTHGTVEIDARIVALTGKIRPRALFVPTASGDAEEYIEAFKACYGTHLGCDTDALRLIHNPPTFDKISAAILNADLIYVGGGNTYRMMRVWRRLKLDALLAEAAARGTVLSGLSAGAVCWFRYGHSDSRAATGNPEWSYIRVSGLGFINATYCPHYHAEKRESSFAEMIATRGGIGIACDDNAALEVVGDRYRVLTASPNAKAYKLFKRAGSVVITELPQGRDYASLDSLLSRKSAHA